MSRIDRWGATVNGVAAWSFWDMGMRARLLRRFGLTIGDNTEVQAGCFFGSDSVVVGDSIHIGPRCFLDGSAALVMEPGSGLSYEVALITGNHDFGPPSKRYGAQRNAPVTIGAGSWVGARATVLPGVTVGSGCVIGAGALVTRDCEPDTVYVGSPSRPVKTLPSGLGREELQALAR